MPVVSKRLAFLMAGSGMALAMSIPPAQAQSTDEIQERQLNVVGSFSTSNLFPDYEKPFWTETLPAASGGRLTANLQAFDLLGLNGNAVFQMVSDGVYDVGTTVMDYVAGDVPVVEGADIPAIADPAKMRGLVEAYKPALEKIFDQTYDAKLLAVLPFSMQVVFCKAEIGGLDDLSGKRIRGSGRMTMDFIQAIGGTGVSIAFNEVPVALDRGVVDCGVTGMLSGFLAGWSEVSTHFYPLPVGGWDPVGILIRNDVWSELNEPTQKLLAEQLAGLEDKVWADVGKVNQTGIACSTGGECPYGEAQDMKLVEVTDADLQRALEVMEASVLPQWAERCGQECVEFWNQSAGKVLGIAAGQK